MSEWGPVTWVFLVPVVGIIAVVTSTVVATISRSRVRELEIRERIAMIERGLVPPPEVDPKGFDQAMGRLDRLGVLRDQSASAGRHRRAGVVLMGVGFGLIVLIAFAGDAPQVAIGVGGFLVVIGLAFFVNSLFEARQPLPIPRQNGTTAGTQRPSDPIPPS